MDETATTPGISRRGLLLTGAAAGIGASLGLTSILGPAGSAAAATSAVDPAVVAQSAVYVNFTTRVAKSYGVTKTIGTLVSGDGNVSPGATNLMGTLLPFTGGDPATNTVPQGLEWHGSSVPKTLISFTGDSIRFSGKTTSTTSYLGGVRTQRGIVAPGQNAIVSFTADFVSLTGDPNATLLVQLLRSNAQTLYERAYNPQEDAGTRCMVRLTAPAGGTEPYRVVFMALAGSSAAGQEAVIDIANISVVPEPAAPPLGIRFTTPKYSRTSVPVKTLIVKPAVPAGEYYLLLKTDECGWAAESVMIDSPATQINAKDVFGATADLTVRELIFIARSRWSSGWMTKVSPVSWTPLRYLNINASAGQSRMESPNGVARSVGFLTQSTGAPPEADNNYPLANLDAPPVDSVAFDAGRRSYLSFATDTASYIGDTGTVPLPTRAEIGFRKSVDFGQHAWLSCWFRALGTLSDTSASRKALIMQYRYTKNASGDTSQLGPDFAFEQWTNNRFVCHYRTDDGVPVLTGKSTPVGITTAELGPWTYVPGQWNRLVAHTVFSDTGAGYLGLWLNGDLIIDQPVKMGYKRNAGPKFRFGSYKYSDYPSQIEFQHLEQGARDLTSRIARPLPV